MLIAIAIFNANKRADGRGRILVIMMDKMNDDRTKQSEGPFKLYTDKRRAVNVLVAKYRQPVGKVLQTKATGRPGSARCREGKKGGRKRRDGAVGQM